MKRTKIKKWGDLFENVDSVGQSEYRALSELCADANDINNIGGEVDPEAPLTEEQVNHIDSVLTETIDQAVSLKRAIYEAAPQEHKVLEDLLKEVKTEAKKLEGTPGETYAAVWTVALRHRLHKEQVYLLMELALGPK